MKILMKWAAISCAILYMYMVLLTSCRGAGKIKIFDNKALNLYNGLNR